MKHLITSLLFIICFAAIAQKQDTRYFELRIYYAHTGTLNTLTDRFRNHTTKIFERIGIDNIGYWLPVTNDQNALYFMLAYPNKDAVKPLLTAFSGDPEWKDIVAKMPKEKALDSVTTVFMQLSDIMPGINSSPAGERVFELRTYTCLPGRLPNLITRFKNHTLKLFKKHHMESIAYFTSEEKEGVQPRLIYILAHPSVEAAAKSWDSFRGDPDWIAAKDDSEKDGKIVANIKSVFLKPLIFSKIK